MCLWSQMGEKCMMAMEAKFWDLVLLFKINVILLSISFFVFLCIICLGAAYLGSAFATGGRGGDCGWIHKYFGGAQPRCWGEQRPRGWADHTRP